MNVDSLDDHIEIDFKDDDDIEYSMNKMSITPHRSFYHPMAMSSGSDPSRHAKTGTTAHSHWMEGAVWRYGHLVHRILNIIIILEIDFNMVIQAIHIHSRCVKVAKLLVNITVVAVCCLD